MSASVLGLAIAVLPAAALAERGSGDSVEGSAGADIQMQTVDVSASGTVVAGQDDENVPASDKAAWGSASNDDEQATSSENDREQAKQAMERSRENAKEAFERIKENFPFFIDSSTTAALSLDALKRSIELRKEELDQQEEDASTTPEVHETVKDVNPVRLAVHTLLASKALLGGIGPQVSEIAKEMNDSIATTTTAELKMRSRGFFSRLLFGGDKESARTLSQAVAENQARIDVLTTLMNQASTTPELKATLQTQITALQDAQAHLQALADIEAKSWGLFSWRF
ncbi:MAG TPA: hypothetical protein VFP46_02875 [Candidatus Paceibacterota bacterium]|nr:hypothetical protein [Candidatus Paceibacterota bacterium]